MDGTEKQKLRIPSAGPDRVLRTKKSKPSPATLTIDYCRREKWIAEKTEHWNQFARRRFDLLGFIDILVLLPDLGITLGIQATTHSNRTQRSEKIRKECCEKAAAWLRCGNRLEVWGWQKAPAGRYEAAVHLITLGYLGVGDDGSSSTFDARAQGDV